MEYSAPAAAATGPFAQLMSSDATLRGFDGVSGNNTVFVSRKVLVGVASQYGHIQIFNPVASGIILIVDRVYVSHSGLSFHIRFTNHNTELTTDDGVWASRSGIGAAGISHMRSENNVAILGTSYDRIWVDDVAAIPLNWNFPIVKQAGEGFMLGMEDVSQELVVTFEGREV